ncbi:MAG TPA: YncE family protein [Terriglobales bacterium]|nr:YncE family protein [Terriglobales bacterium]
MRKLQLLSISFLMFCTTAGAAQLRQVAMIDMPGRPGFDALAFAGQDLVIAHTAAGTLDIFDPAKRRLVAQIKGLDEPRGIAVDDQLGKVYVACAGSNSLAVISTADWTVSDTVELNDEPDFLLLTPLTGTLYIANWHANSVSALNAKTHAIQTAELGGRPEELAHDPEHNLLYVTLQDRNEVVVLNPDLKTVRTFALRGSMPTGIAFDPKMRHLFVAVRSAVLVLNADSGVEMSRIPTEEGVDTVWFDDSTRSAYAVSNNGVVTMISQQNGRYAAEQELNTVVRGHNVAFDPVRGLVYIPGGFEGRSKLVILKRIETPPATAKVSLK